MERTSEICPKCNSSEVAQYLYGLPSEFPPENLKQYFILGGCCIEETQPDYQCLSCKHEWQDPKTKEFFNKLGSIADEALSNDNENK